MLSLFSTGHTRSAVETGSIVNTAVGFRRRTSSWPEPKRSIGRHIGRFGNHSCWEAVGPARETFRKLGPEIKNHLERCSEPLPSWVTWSVYMMGKTKETAVPTVIFCSDNGNHRRQVRNIIKRSGILDRYPGVATGDMERAPDFDQLVQLAHNVESKKSISRPSRSTNAAALSLSYQGISGMRMQVLKTDVKGNSSREATVGGVIILGDEFCYMTVGHVFRDEFVAMGEPSDSSSFEYDFDFDGDGDSESDIDNSVTDASVGTAKQIEASVANFLGQAMLPTDAITLSPKQQLMESYIRGPHHQRMLEVDPKTSYSTECVSISDQLDQKTDAIIHISSFDGLSSGLDYALVSSSQSNRRLAAASSKGIGKRASRAYVDHEWFNFDGTNVFALQSSGNQLTGRLGGTPSYSSLPGSREFQELFTARFDGPLEPGDCGTWIIDPESGKLVGHIVAGCATRCAAFVAPAYKIFEDIARRLRIEPAILVSSSTNSNTDERAQNHVSKSSHHPSPKPALPPRRSSLAVPQLGSTQSNYTPKANLDVARPTCAAGFLIPRKKVGSSTAHLLTPSTGRDGSNPFSAFTSFAKDLTRRFEMDLSAERRRVLSKAIHDLRLQQERERDSWPRRKGIEHGRVYYLLAPIIHNLPIIISSPNTPRAIRFQNMLISLSEIPMRWENPKLLDDALAILPLPRIYCEAENERQRLLAEAKKLNAKTKTSKQPAWGHQDCVIRSLMRWFKRDFFSWINRPTCSQCGWETTPIGMVQLSANESAQSASRVEGYKCNNSNCGSWERFPRYNDAFFLCKTRKGRVGEWSNCFGMLCRALGARVRWVWNAEDHIWLEIYSTHRQRWVHVDVCEQTWDRPLLYTEYWQRKLTYCIAFSADGALDVTPRYARQRQHCGDRQRATEGELAYILKLITEKRRSQLLHKNNSRWEAEYKTEAKELQDFVVSSLTTKLCSDLARHPIIRRNLNAHSSQRYASTSGTELRHIIVTSGNSSGREEGQGRSSLRDDNLIEFTNPAPEAEPGNSDGEISFVDSRCGDELDLMKAGPRFPPDRMVEWLS